jgi:hypothetical protein
MNSLIAGGPCNQIHPSNGNIHDGAIRVDESSRRCLKAGDE